MDVSYSESTQYLSILPLVLNQIRSLGTRENPGVLNGSIANYNFYQSKDGKWFSFGAVEYRFYIQMLALLKINIDSLDGLTEQQKKLRLQSAFGELTSQQITKMVEDKTDL